MNAHPPQPRRLGGPLVGDDPSTLGKRVEFHREGHGGVERGNATILEVAHHGARRIVNGVAGCVELEIGHRACGRAHRFAVHAAQQHEQRLRRREGTEDMRPVFRQQRVVDRHDAAVVGAKPPRQRVQPRGGKHVILHLGIHRALPFRL